MNSEQFVSELNARVARYDLLCHPYYQAWSQGKLTHRDLREYASEYFHHVASFPTYLSALHSRLEDGELRRAVLRNLVDEEIEGRAHSDLWLDFAEGMGAEREDIRKATPSPALDRLITNFRTVAQTGSRAEALAAFYAYESQVPKIAIEKARGLKDNYGADAKTIGYFALHAYADVRHSAVWRDELLAEVEGRPNRAEQALQAAETAAQWLWETLDALEEQRTRSAAAVA